MNWFLSIWQGVAPLFAGGIVAWVGYHFGRKSAMKVSDRQKRQEVFSQLNGLKYTVPAGIVRRSDMLFRAYGYELQARLHPEPAARQEAEEAKYLIRKDEDAVWNVIESLRLLHEKIGLIRIIFGNTRKLEELLSALPQPGCPQVNKPTPKKTQREIAKWEKETKTELLEIIYNNYEVPITNLLHYLETELQAEQSASFTSRVINSCRDFKRRVICCKTKCKP